MSSSRALSSNAAAPWYEYESSPAMTMTLSHPRFLIKSAEARPWNESDGAVLEKVGNWLLSESAGEVALCEICGIS